MAWAARAAGSPVVGVRALAGGKWHAIHVLRLADGRRLLLRRRVSDWQVTDPEYTIEREAAVLDLLRQAGVAAPRVVAADPGGAETGAGALLLTWLAGGPAGDWLKEAAALDQLAAALGPVHAIAAPEIPAYRRYYEPARLSVPAWVRDRGVWEALVAIVSGPEPASARCLIHRDYHAANTVWRRRLLTGIIDWTQASSGPPGIDVAHMRHNLAGELGLEAADRFLELYLRRAGAASGHHPYWDLVTIADGGSWSFPPEFLSRIEPYVRSVLRRF